MVRVHHLPLLLIRPNSCHSFFVRGSPIHRRDPFLHTCRFAPMEEYLDVEKVIQEFEEITKDAERVQRQVLEKILKENGDCEYLQKQGLHGRTDLQSFKSIVPIVHHHDLEPYIQRLIDGNAATTTTTTTTASILTGKPITTISLSSGTTQGKSKFVPFNDQLFHTTAQIYRTSFAFRNRKFPLDKGKALSFVYSSKRFKTNGGLSVGTATTNVFRHPNYKSNMKAIQSPSCSPDEVVFGSDYQQSLYCHLLCGLVSRNEIQLVSSTFAHSIVHAFETFQQVWEHLTADIRHGTLSDHITDSSIRNAMAMLLRPNPELADQIHILCTKLSDDWNGLIPALFPNAKYILGIMTGSMEPYLKKLRWFAGRLPLTCADYGASEGWIAAVIDPGVPPESATFAVLPQIGYFEFMPLRNSSSTHAGGRFKAHGGAYSEPKPLGLTDVKVGEEYEVIITNVAGLYRYRLGDVVRITGFHNSTPKLKFICRKNLLLTINIDKNNEHDLQLSVEKAASRLSSITSNHNNNKAVEIVDFTSHVDRSTEPGHYVIFWELNGNVDEGVLKECCNCLDQSFVDAGYISSRKVGGIAPLELRILQKGTFKKIMNHYANMGGAVSQFKMPRCVPPGNKSILQILFNNVVNSYFSTAYGV